MALSGRKHAREGNNSSSSPPDSTSCSLAQSEPKPLPQASLQPRNMHTVTCNWPWSGLRRPQMTDRWRRHAAGQHAVPSASSEETEREASRTNWAAAVQGPRRSHNDSCYYERHVLRLLPSGKFHRQLLYYPVHSPSTVGSLTKIWLPLIFNAFIASMVDILRLLRI